MPINEKVAATSETPETDNNAGYEDGSGCWKSRINGEFVYADFARDLERRLRAAKEEIIRQKHFAFDARQEVGLAVQRAEAAERERDEAKEEADLQHEKNTQIYGRLCKAEGELASVKADAERWRLCVETLEFPFQDSERDGTLIPNKWIFEPCDGTGRRGVGTTPTQAIDNASATKGGKT